MAQSKTDSAKYAPENFMSGHCKTEVEEVVGAAYFLRKAVDTELSEDGVVEDASMLQTEDNSEAMVELNADAEFEQAMEMEEQLAKQEQEETKLKEMVIEGQKEFLETHKDMFASKPG